jgi:uncharacterized protein (DUF305 family)
MRAPRSFALAATALIVAVVAGGEAVADRHDAGRTGHQHGGSAGAQPAQGQPAQGHPDHGAPAQGAPAQGDDVDRDFVIGMVPHHQAAIEMAQVVLNRGRSAKVRNLAQSIIDDQQNEITYMSALAEEKWGSRPARQRPGPMGALMGLPITMDMSTMADHMSQTANVDRMFLEMMIPHHAAAISMAQEITDRGVDQRIIKMARTVISSQAREIANMQRMLDRGF